jgi:hypothetical protein
MESYFESIGHIIKAEFEASNIFRHGGKKGSSRENIIAKHLRQLMPERYGFGKGEIRSHNGKISPECDLIIYDKFNCPIIYNDKESQIFPIESVYAIIESKSTIKTEHLIKFSETLESLRDYSIYERSISTSAKYEYPFGSLMMGVEPEPAGFFIGLSGLNLDTIQEKLLEHYRKKGNITLGGKNNFKINATCVIGEGVVTQISESNWDFKSNKRLPVIDPTTYPHTYEHYLEIIEDQKNWFRLFFGCLYSVINYSIKRVTAPAFLNYLNVTYENTPNSKNKLPGVARV